jgi:murein DD-endopeptidase MepM/ murein hydrolase activator NlpD
MSQTPIKGPASFGKRNTVNTITLSRNGKVSQINVNPIAASILACFAFTFLIGYFGATAYLVFRDDLIGASFARQARIQHEYEDRIASLRSKLDRITSRQLLDQQAIEVRVRKLMERQETLGSRDGAMSNLLEKAEARGLGASISTGRTPIPQRNPAKLSEPDRELTTGSLTPNAVETLNIEQQPLMASSFTLRGAQSKAFEVASNQPDFTSTQFTSHLFGEVSEAIQLIDQHQRDKVKNLRIAAHDRIQKIKSALTAVGVKVKPNAETGVGGPFVPLNPNAEFSDHMEALELSLQHYDTVTGLARKLPIGTPVKNPKVSSRFGTRVDPFNGRAAMHSGLDFKASTGTPILATGDGKVIKAGRSGGYGKLVEIRHANGLSTRYAHMSKMSVKVGQYVRKGSVIGKVGSTGRSTGPHLHYEVRSSKSARNPAKYIAVGRKIGSLL